MSGFIVFGIWVISWWLILFMLLPIGIKVDVATGEGHATGTPTLPFIGWKMLGATVLSVLITGLFYMAVVKGWFDFLHLEQG